jgi:hypothetical protein
LSLTPDQRQLLDLKNQGLTRKQIGDVLGISARAVKARLERARAWANAPTALTSGAAAIGADTPASVVWTKTHKDGSVTYSVQHSSGNAKPSIDTIIDEIEDRFKALPAVLLAPPQKAQPSDLLTFYALADIHMGMRAWGAETGEDYDTEIASARVTDGMQRLVSSGPQSGQALIVSIGDTLHANDQTNMTPASRHVLDVDTRHHRTLDAAIETFAAAVDLAAQKHALVTFCILPGNHDHDAYRCIMFAMRERYRACPHVSIVTSPMEFFVHDFGRVMIACHHGHKAKAERLVMDAADRWPEMWGRTRHRYYFTGHLHHHKAADIGGMAWEQLRAVSAKDAYASSHAFSARARMQAIVFDGQQGEIERHSVGFGL